MITRKLSLLFALAIIFMGMALLFSCSGGDDDDDDDNDDNDTGDDDDDDDNDDNDTGDDDDDDDDISEVDVSANDSDGVPTGVQFTEGDLFSITATGTVTLEEGGDPVGPDGTGDACATCPLATAPRGALIGQISADKAEDWFLVGSFLGDTASGDGELILKVNDDSYDDNGGQFHALVDTDPDSVAPPASDDTGVFVSKDGDDENPGTMESPMLTIGAGVLEAAASGKDVFVAAGLYQEKVETTVSLYGGYKASDWTRDISANQTTIQAISSEKITIDIAISIAAETEVTVEGFTISGDAGSKAPVDITYGIHVNEDAKANIIHNNIDGGPGIYEAYGVRARPGVDVTIVDNEITNSGTRMCYSFKNEESGHFTIVDNVIGGGVEDTSRGVTISSSEDGTMTGMIRDNEIDGGTGDSFCGAVAIYASDNGTTEVTITDNTITAGTGTDNAIGVFLSSRGQGDLTATITGNNIHGGTEADSTTGINVSTTGEGDITTMIENNEIHGGTADDASTGVSLVRAASGTGDIEGTVVNNLVQGGSGDEGYSKAIHVNSASVTLVNNILLAGEGGYASIGVNLPESADATIVNNVIHGGSAGDQFSRGVRVEGNSRAILLNNIIDGGSSDSMLSIGVTTWVVDDQDDANITLRNNDIYGPEMDYLVSVFGIGGEDIDDIIEVNNCGWDSCTNAGDNLHLSPMFRGSGDYHISDGSPCVDSGVDPITWYTGGLADTDMDGDPRPQGLGWDIGADEEK